MTPTLRQGWRQTTVRRVLRPLDRPAQPELGVITAYRDGVVTLRSNRREDGYTFSDTENGYQEIRPGDLVFHALDGFAGAVGVSDSRGNASPVYHVCEPVAGDDPAFIARLLRHLGTAGFLTTQAPSVRERSVDFRNWSTFARIPLFLPSAAEQRSIANYLDRETSRIDTLIDEQQRLIEMLRERRQAVVDESLHPDADWEVHALKFALDGIDQGVSPQAESDLAQEPGSWGVLKSGCVNRGVFNPLEHKRLPDDFAVDERLAVSLGDLLVSRASGSPDLVGSAGTVDRLGYNLILSDKLFRLRLRDGHEPRFFYWLLNSRHYRTQVRQSISGAEGLANNLPLSALRNFSIAVPPAADQRRIAAYLNDEIAKLDALIAETVRFIELSRERRAALITAAVTGQVDVQIGEA
ncbi:hypothetical protein ACFX43_09180 [Nocardioides sp. YIM B13467]|uniref:hypothetical protein n=1 Tax=Nocardioides sp. YIM B13467 TaxID=3366294 RepID=UPI0036723862